MTCVVTSLSNGFESLIGSFQGPLSTIITNFQRYLQIKIDYTSNSFFKSGLNRSYFGLICILCIGISGYIPASLGMTNEMGGFEWLELLN
jgi:hypothetical protein